MSALEQRHGWHGPARESTRPARRRGLASRRPLCLRVRASADPETIEANKKVYTERDYLAQHQSRQRQQWQSNVRNVTGRRHHAVWEPELSPPALLSQVTVVLVSPRRPISVGTVARACSCFEVEDVRMVMPRCDHLTRHAKSASKGAQYILHRTQLFDSIREATKDCSVRVAFTRWTDACSLPFYDLSALTDHPAVQAVITAPVPDTPTQQSTSHTHDNSDISTPYKDSPHQPHAVSALQQREQSQPGQVGLAHQAGQRQQGTQPQSQQGHYEGGPKQGIGLGQLHEQGNGHQGSLLGGLPGKVAFVFGREELGMSDDEVGECDVVCSIPIGRLQESLSLSHAVSLALCNIFQARLAHISAPQNQANGTQNAADAYRVCSVDSLAAGYDLTVGRER